MNAFENDILGDHLSTSVPEVASPKSPPTADALLRVWRRRVMARRCIVATGGAACLWLLGVSFWALPRPSSSPRVATPGDAGAFAPAPRHMPAEAVAPAADIAPVISDLPFNQPPVRVVWTDEETGQSVAIGYLRPARIRQLPMWKLPPAIQQDVRQHAAANGDPLDPEI